MDNALECTHPELVIGTACRDVRTELITGTACRDVCMIKCTSCAKVIFAEVSDFVDTVRKYFGERCVKMVQDYLERLECGHSGRQIILPDNPDNLPVECPVCWMTAQLSADGLFPVHDRQGPSTFCKRWKLDGQDRWYITEGIL
jgi:hypothetical protein